MNKSALWSVHFSAVALCGVRMRVKPGVAEDGRQRVKPQCFLFFQSVLAQTCYVYTEHFICLITFIFGCVVRFWSHTCIPSIAVINWHSHCIALPAACAVCDCHFLCVFKFLSFINSISPKYAFVRTSPLLVLFWQFLIFFYLLLPFSADCSEVLIRHTKNDVQHNHRCILVSSAWVLCVT